MTEYVPSEPDPRTEPCGVVIFQSCVVAGTSEPINTQLVRAVPIDEGIVSGVRQGEIEVADETKVVVKSADQLCAQTQVESELLGHFPIVLREERVVVCAVLVVVNATAAEAKVYLASEHL